MGAVGVRAVSADLARYGHKAVELERGSADTKLWKDVKRKRVRIPDLVCLNCGRRIESRAKNKPELSMSHSFADDTRAWDYGMIDEDWIAFPICEPSAEENWSTGRLEQGIASWQERAWTRWEAKERIEYVSVQALRNAMYRRKSIKGVTEGSEATLAWGATFSSREGIVDVVADQTITVRRTTDGYRHTRRVPLDQRVLVAPGEAILENQIIASSVVPISSSSLGCTQRLDQERFSHLLGSRERTQRFTGVKLARLLGLPAFAQAIGSLAADREEDVYVRLEAAAYLASVCNESVRNLFGHYFESADQQTQLEAVIAISEIHAGDSVAVLSEILGSSKCYFLRSAAAWGLGRIGTPSAITTLISTFADFDWNLREEALDSIVAIGQPAVPMLLQGLRARDEDIAAGCAESLRQQDMLSAGVIPDIFKYLESNTPPIWAVWLVGNLPRDHVAARIALLQKSSPKLHYAISVLWSFVESWIARRWELNPRAAFGSSNENSTSS